MEIIEIIRSPNKRDRYWAEAQNVDPNVDWAHIYSHGLFGPDGGPQKLLMLRTPLLCFQMHPQQQ